MARGKKAVAIAEGGKSIAAIDQELNQEVALLKEQIGQPGGNKFKVQPSGNFTGPDGNDYGDQIQIIVLDFVSSNRLYLSRYDPNSPSPPDCYAIGRKIDDMKPEKDAPAVQNADCKSCPMNAFKSGDSGKGKACKNTRDLAFLLVDPQNPEAHNDPDAPIYTFSVSPTSIRAFDGAVSNVARALGGPPIKAILTLSGKQAFDNAAYATTSFTDPVPNPDYAAHVARRVQCQEVLFRKPDYAGFLAQQKTAPRGAAARGAAPRGGRPAARR